MSMQSRIDALVNTYDDPKFRPDIDAADGVTAGMVLLKEMRDALERLSDLMCRNCEGNGFVRNPHARYSEEYADGRRTGQYSTNDPEEMTCPLCEGVGFAMPQAKDLPPRLADLSEEPF